MCSRCWRSELTRLHRSDTSSAYQTNYRLESKWGKIKQVVSRNDAIDELILTLILVQEVAKDHYLCEYHRVGSCPRHTTNPVLDALAMNLSPYAFDIDVDKFNYANGMYTKGRAVSLMSCRTSITHVVNAKVRILYHNACCFGIYSCG